jgi:hypothetical protein
MHSSDLRFPALQSRNAAVILKPIVWNTAGYERPRGKRVNSGFPKDHGYGHEEWNNASVTGWSEAGRDYRPFHTEVWAMRPSMSTPGRFSFFCMRHTMASRS